MTSDYFDIHSHLPFRDYDQDLPEVLNRMEEERVATITVGVDYPSSKLAVDFADAHENFYATIGLHPTDVVTESFDASRYAELAKNPKTVGVGECGLDFFRITGDVTAEKKRQWSEFEKQMAFALEHDLPLMIHCRPSKNSMDAYEELLSRLESEFKQVGERIRGNVHFFVGNVDIARRFYDIGFTTSYTGVLTFTHDYDEVVKFAPLDRLLTETDSPFVAPVPFRGKRNEPLYVKYVVEALAKIRGVEVEQIRRAAADNAKRLFRI